jgi:3'-5' exoribonuclease 1
METIEIGAIIVPLTDATPPREYQSFVRPTRFPQLSEFCKSLTSIQQENVDDAATFPVTFAEFLEWVGDPGAVRFSSWGEYDRKQLMRDCQNHHIPYPFGDGHFNIKRYFADRCGCEPQGMGQALKRLKIELKGTHHRALDDARNILHILSVVTNGDLSQVLL